MLVFVCLTPTSFRFEKSSLGMSDSEPSLLQARRLCLTGEKFARVERREPELALSPWPPLGQGRKVDGPKPPPPLMTPHITTHHNPQLPSFLPTFLQQRMSALLASSSSVSALQMSSLLETLTSASPAEIDEVRRLLRLTTSVVSPPAPPKPASVTSSKVTAKFEFPAHTEGEPSAADYRFPEELIDESLCLARDVGNPDNRWSITVYTERQCGRPQVEGSNLCVKCLEQSIKYSVNPKPGNWHGLIDEEPLDWQHMLGNDWASKNIAAGKLVFRAAVTTAEATSETKSVTSAATSRAEELKADAERRIADAKALLAQQKARKESEKLEKEAAKLAEKARKEAEKAEKAALKEAEKAEKAAAKELAKALKVKLPTVASKAAPKVAAKLPEVPPPPAEPKGTVQNIDGEFYWVDNGAVYAYNLEEETVLQKLGTLTGNGSEDTPYGIDTEGMDE